MFVSNDYMAKIEKIELLVSLLNDIIESPEQYSQSLEILNALSSQDGLARYSNIERGINPCSLNTLKRQAANNIAHNFTYIDELRKKAYIALRKAGRAKSTKKNKEQLVVVVRNLRDEIIILEEELATLTWLITRLSGQARNYARQAGSSTKVLCEKEQAENFAMLAARQEDSRERRRSRHSSQYHEN